MSDEICHGTLLGPGLAECEHLVLLSLFRQRAAKMRSLSTVLFELLRLVECNGSLLQDAPLEGTGMSGCAKLLKHQDAFKDSNLKLDRKEFQLRQSAGRAHGGVAECGLFSPHQLQIGDIFLSSSAPEKAHHMIGRLMGEGTQRGTFLLGLVD